MIRYFDEELKELKEKILQMGTISEEMIDYATKALMEEKEELIQEVFTRENKINQLHIEIDEMALQLLALHQPTAIDLRFITAGIKINSDLERIGDLTINITDNILTLLKQPQLKPYLDLPRMNLFAKEMLRKSLDAFINKDVELARSVLLMDTEVDNLKDQIFRELLTFMLSDSQAIERALALILISRHLERIADHATNIAEDAIFIVMGKDVRHHLEKKE
ncbi:phosphate signaling complex protein PhoU [bacterium]|nr:phosphate signaling complex protein PhoU [bacterium]MBU1153390.1 phosphate signaling complex protein PhoU [bacterium]MBU1782245.1 phosphate signaling complex protein PhoU [bacterium]